MLKYYLNVRLSIALFCFVVVSKANGTKDCMSLQPNKIYMI
jgi:hypothetical protein